MHVFWFEKAVFLIIFKAEPSAVIKALQRKGLFQNHPKPHLYTELVVETNIFLKQSSIFCRVKISFAARKKCPLERNNREVDFGIYVVCEANMEIAQ